MKKSTIIFVFILLLTIACSLTSSAPKNDLTVAAIEQPTAIEMPTMPPTSQVIPQPAAFAMPTSPTSPTCWVNAEYLNVRKCPGISCTAIGHLEYGEIVTVNMIEGSWQEVTLMNNKTGWIHAHYCLETPP
jgi:uncharacterized protein YgiM (DUF1202 family)